VATIPSHLVGRTKASSGIALVEQGLERMAATVKEQLADALKSFHERDTADADAVIERDDVVDNLYFQMEERIFDALANAGPSISESRRMRAALRVLSSLEHVGDAACHIAKHVIMLSTEPDGVVAVPLDDLADVAVRSIDESVGAFVRQDIELARLACESERELDEIYVKKLQQLTQLLNDGDHARYLLHVLAVMKYLEKTGDFTLNIGEAAFHSITGTRLKYPQFKQLAMLLDEADKDGTTFRHFWDGISGAIVLEIDSPGRGHFLFKEGARRKMEDEFERGIEWESVAPLHTPRLIGKSQDRDRRAVLREFAEGALLQEILLSSDDDERKFAATKSFAESLIDIWSSTLVTRPARLDYSQQIRTRLREILRRHPELEDTAKAELARWGGIYGTLDLLQRREALLAPPFSVWAHGDLNANNVVFDSATRQVVFIDVHRSRYGDYASDMGVFLTSTFRQFPRKKVARALNLVNDLMIDSVRQFALKNHDTRFEDRLRLARARALITSARLTDDVERADVLFTEGLKYLKKVMRKISP
jgi:phosphate uptake regulator